MGNRILVIEDQQFNRESFEIILRHNGFDVVTSATGRDTFALLEDFNPNLILLDIFLGELDGRDICRKIKQSDKFKNIPVIIISGHPDIYNTITEAGANDIVTKPFDEKTLIDRIHRQIKYPRKFF